MPTELRLAAIDVGSNSIHMVIAQVDAAGTVTTLWRVKEMVGLGRISFPSKRLTSDAIDRAIVTLRRFQQVAQHRQCEKIIAVATSAVREAENGGEFIERVHQQLGLYIKVVSGRDEARLIYEGVRHATDLKGGPHLIFDIGGGSVEFIVGTESKPLLLESRKLGAARMTARYIKSDPVDAKDLAALLKHYDQELTPICQAIAEHRPVKVFGTSGTVENLALMSGGSEKQATGGHGSRNGSRNGSRDGRLALALSIDRDKLMSLVGNLLESTAADRETISGLDEKRQDQIIAGALLVSELFRRLDLKKAYVCKSALREGVLADYLSRHMPELQIRREVPDPRRRSVLDLARRCNWHQPHSEQVARLVLQLFDKLKPLHGLGRGARELIEYGVLLHDIGWHISPSAHHKHSMYLIQHGALKEFKGEEVQIIANIARYHRKSLPKPEHEYFATLSPQGKRIVRIGAALLRMGDALDRTHTGVVTNLQVRITHRQVHVGLQCKGDPELEIWAARRKTDLFSELFDRTIAFEQIKR